MPSRLKFLSYTHSKIYWTCENAVWGKINKYGIIYKSEQLRMFLLHVTTIWKIKIWIRIDS